MGWKLPCSLEQYSLYTFGRLSSTLCLSEFKRRVKRALCDHLLTYNSYGKHSSIKSRVYADFLFLASCITGIGYVYSLLLTMIIYTLTHNWKVCGGYRWIIPTWKVKLYGATKPLEARFGL